MGTGFTDALIARRDIEAPGGTFAVRGLTPEDVFTIYRRHSGEIGAWFEKLQSGNVDMSLDTAPLLVASVMDTIPTIGAEIVACGAGRPDDEGVILARQLSLGVQTAALEAIAELTFTQEMPPKKLLETVVRMIGSMNSPIETPTA